MGQTVPNSQYNYTSPQQAFDNSPCRKISTHGSIVSSQSDLNKNTSSIASQTKNNNFLESTSKLMQTEPVTSPSFYKILKCRERFKIRQSIRRMIESTIFSDTDDRPYGKITIFDEPLLGLLDSGANVSALGKGCMEFISRNNVSFRKYKSFLSTANGDRQNIIGYCKLPVFYKNVTKNIVFYLVPSLTQVAYLGVDFWRVFGIAPEIIPCISEMDRVLNDDDSKFHKLSPDQQLLLDKAILAFPSFEKMGLGCTDLLEHHIDTGDSVPIKAKHYPLSPPRQAEAYEEIDRLLSMGVIEESNSPWCSPAVLVRKPGKVRLCIDSRRLNSVTKKDSYPLPHISGLLSRLKDTHFISGIDLKDAFLQIRLSESSKEKTAFAIPGKPLYQYKFMPFGLCNGPQTMSRLMDRVIPSRLRENVFIYLDDLLVCSPDFDSHLKLLGEVSDCLRSAKLTINVSKSKFCQREIKYLGYVVGQGCLKVDSSKVESITNFPLPKSPRQVRRFIGMANWYRGFIQNFANLSGPLTDCLKKSNKPFKLSDSAIDSFKKLKVALSSAPVLAQPNFSKEFVIQCDASKIGVGGVLLQFDDEGREHPIAFVSQKLNRAQQNYTVTELECLAAVLSVQRFRPYIEGLPFRIVTDHSSLRWLMGQKDLSGRLARWSLKLQRFDFQIEHRKGSLNTVPDTLSRFDVDELTLGIMDYDIDLENSDFDGEEYSKLRDTVSERKNSLPDLCVRDKHVFKRVKFRQGFESEEKGLWRLWLPSSLTENVIKASHDSYTTCHGGFSKTLARVRQKYFWPTMSKDIKMYVSNCDTCKSIKSNNQISRPPMGDAFQTFRPFQRLFCDFLGPYTCSKFRNSYIFICLDHLTKFIFLKPMRAATTTNVTLFFQSELFPTFGVPQYVHSDNGKQFISKDMKLFLNLYGIEHIKTGFYAPQSNASERANREIITKIRCFLEGEKDHSNWDKHIPQILSILRSDYHSSINCSPYYALFGQNMCQHASSYRLLEKLNSLNYDQFNITTNSDKLHNIREKLKDNLDKAHERASKSYNLRSRKVSFEPGQIIFRKNHVLSNLSKKINSKFMPKFLKCKVRKRIGNSLYELEDLKGNYVGRYHATDLKR